MVLFILVFPYFPFNIINNKFLKINYYIGTIELVFDMSKIFQSASLKVLNVTLKNPTEVL